MSVPSVEGPRRPSPLPVVGPPSGPAAEEDDLRAVIGPNAEIYLAYLAKVRAKGGTGIDWSWAPFFLGAIWFFYRKLYRIGLLYVAAVITTSVFLPAPLADIAILPVWIASTLFARKVYMDSAFQRIAEANSRGLTGETRRAWLARNGGTSLAAASGLVVVILLLAAAVGQYAEPPPG